MKQNTKTDFPYGKQTPAIKCTKISEEKRIFSMRLSDRLHLQNPFILPNQKTGKCSIQITRALCVLYLHTPGRSSANAHRELPFDQFQTSFSHQASTAFACRAKMPWAGKMGSQPSLAGELINDGLTQMIS